MGSKILFLGISTLQKNTHIEPTNGTAWDLFPLLNRKKKKNALFLILPNMRRFCASQTGCDTRGHVTRCDTRGHVTCGPCAFHETVAEALACPCTSCALTLEERLPCHQSACGARTNQPLPGDCQLQGWGSGRPMFQKEAWATWMHLLELATEKT